MARTPRIRLTKNDRKEYARLVKNAKAKAKRINKKYGLDMLDLLEIPKLSDFKTRQDFNEFKEDIGSFNSRWNKVHLNKDNVPVPRYVEKKIQANVQTYNNFVGKKRKELGNKPYFVNNEVVMSVSDRLSMEGKRTSAILNLKPSFKINDVPSINVLKDYYKEMKKRVRKDDFNMRTDTMRENFIGVLERAFNDEVDDIVRRLRELPVDVYYEMYFQHKEFDFKDYYPKPNGEISGDYSKLEKILDDYDAGKFDSDYIPFGNRV